MRPARAEPRWAQFTIAALVVLLASADDCSLTVRESTEALKTGVPAGPAAVPLAPSPPPGRDRTVPKPTDSPRLPLYPDAPTPRDLFGAPETLDEPDVAVGATGPATPAHQMWRAVRKAHPLSKPLGGRGPLSQTGIFAAQGALYTYDPLTQQIVVALARSLRLAAYAIEATPESALLRSFALWVPGDDDEIRKVSPILRAPKSALQAGRPIKVMRPEDWPKVPHVAGIYRIHLLIAGESCVYVGRSQDLRRRPFRHEKTSDRMWGGNPDGIRYIELIPVKPQHRMHVWTITDLDEAEETHIARARYKQQTQGGPHVINVTMGRNGPPSRPPSRVFVWAAAIATVGDDPQALRGVRDR